LTIDPDATYIDTFGKQKEGSKSLDRVECWEGGDHREARWVRQRG
jgi:hypothetical protein